MFAYNYQFSYRITIQILFYLQANWFHAHEFCNSLDMKLVNVPNKAAHDKLVKFIKESDEFSEKARYWLGATDLGEQGSFTWVANGRTATFTNWAKGRPNYTDPLNRCLEMAYWPSLSWDWTWDNSNCRKNKFYFICEKSNKQNCKHEFWVPMWINLRELGIGCDGVFTYTITNLCINSLETNGHRVKVPPVKLIKKNLLD